MTKDTKFDLGKIFRMEFDDEWFVPAAPPHPHVPPKLGKLNPSQDPLIKRKLGDAHFGDQRGFDGDDFHHGLARRDDAAGVAGLEQVTVPFTGARTRRRSRALPAGQAARLARPHAQRRLFHARRRGAHPEALQFLEQGRSNQAEIADGGLQVNPGFPDADDAWEKGGVPRPVEVLQKRQPFGAHAVAHPP